MSVIGFDIGNENCVIASAKRGGINVFLNDVAKRESPAVVTFGDKQRFLGSAGAAFATANPNSTISQIKRLIGRQYKEPSVQEELKSLPFKTSEGLRGGILIELEYMKKKWMFTPVEILGMLLKHLKQIAEKNLEYAVVDCVIGVPSYFTDLHRREYLDAATIAGLKPLTLMHDGTAIALGYGMYKTDLDDEEPIVVVFVDIGHSDTQVTVAEFEQGKMKILSHTFDQNLGGRDFDELLFEHFAAQFKEQYKIDVHSNARASIRLRASCEKLKKVLSANTEASLDIECLIEDTDVKGIITREEFEHLSNKLLERVKVPCIKAVKDSDISPDEIYTIELVGSGSRIPAITKILTSLFQKEPTRTLNASECVARGCALRCAMLSSTQQVRDYEVQDVFPYSLVLLLVDNDGKQPPREIVLCPKGSPFPTDRKIILRERTPLELKVFYANKTDFPAGMSPKVGHFKIGLSQSSGSEKVKARCILQLNKHGIVELKSVSPVEDNRPKNCHSQPENMVASLAFTDNLDVTTTQDELGKAKEKEHMLAQQDIKVEQTKDQRNTLESFVYDTRSKLSSAYRSFATDSEKKGIAISLQETEDWLYEDGDDDSDEPDYTSKLEYLKKLLDPIEKRYKDEDARAKITKAMRTFIEEHRSATEQMSLRHKDEVKKECLKIEQFLNDHQRQESFKNMDPLGWASVTQEAMELFKRNIKVIMTSKRSSPKHEPMDQRDQCVDQSDNPMDSTHMGSNQMNQTQWDEPIYSKWRHVSNLLDTFRSRNRREQPMGSSQREQTMGQNQWNKTMGSTLREQTIGLNQSDRTMDSNQRDHDMGTNQKDWTMSSNPRYKTVSSNQTDQAVGTNQWDRTMGYQRGKIMGSNQGGQIMGSNQGHQTLGSYIISEHPLNSENKDQPVSSGQRDKPQDSDQRYQQIYMEE